MHAIQELIFKFDPGKLNRKQSPRIIIKISETRVSYQEIYLNDKGEDEKSPIWTAMSDGPHFYDLTATICHALYVRFPESKDHMGTEVISLRDKGDIEQNFVPYSLEKNYFGPLKDEILYFLKGLKVPPFLK